MFALSSPIPNGPLVQGEVLAGLTQYRVEAAAEVDGVQATPIRHPYAIVLTQMCDLQHDFKARFSDREGINIHGDYRRTPEKYLLEGVLLCKAEKEGEFRNPDRGVNRRVFEEAQKNQHERFHCLGPLHESSAHEDSSYRLFLDFKRIWVTPPEGLYEVVHNQQRARLGVVPPPFMTHLVQRFCNFYGRIALPDEENDVPYLSQE